MPKDDSTRAVSASYLLGQSFALLSQCRAYMIQKHDVEGVTLIEDGYLSLSNDIQKIFYGDLTLGGNDGD